MCETLALPEDDVRCALRAMDADLQATLALSRATLRALAALSPLLNTAADAALEDEADRAAPQQTLDIVEDMRRRLQQAPAEAKMAQALQRALVDAAEALPNAAPARATQAA